MFDFLVEGNLTCRDLRILGSTIGALTDREISSISAETIFQCVSAFGSIENLNRDQLKTLAEKFIDVSSRKRNRIKTNDERFLSRHFSGFGKFWSTHQFSNSGGTVRNEFDRHRFHGRSIISAERQTFSRWKFSFFHRKSERVEFRTTQSSWKTFDKQRRDSQSVVHRERWVDSLRCR